MCRLKRYLYPALFLIIAMMISWQINQPPFERFPQWDNFWGNILQAGKLLALRLALLSGELPALNPFVGFGWNNFGDTTVPQHFLLPINLLVLLMSPERVISLRMILMLSIGGWGTFLYLKQFIANTKLSFFSGILFMTVPFVISFNYYYPLLDMFLMVPWVLWSIHRYFADRSRRNRVVFVLAALLAIAAGDVFAFVTIIPVIGLYGLVVGRKYYKFAPATALRESAGLLILACLAGGFYIVPLYWNLHEISAFKRLLGDTFQPQIGGTSLAKFLYFIAKYCLLSIILPIEGSGTLLYAPSFFYIACFYYLRNHRSDKHYPIILGLLYSAGLMFLIGILFYLFPSISRTGNGILRYQMNLLPFAILLSGLLSLHAIHSDGKSTEIRNILLTSLTWDIMLFIVPILFHGGLWHINHISRGLLSSNHISIRLFEDMWEILPFLNATMLLAILCLCHMRTTTNKTSFGIVACICLLPIYSLSFHNEIRANQQAPWQQVTRLSYRYDAYQQRRECLATIIGTNNLNYRVLPSGKKFDDKGHGRNFKFIATTELGLQDQNKILFSYKETMHPYTGLLYSMFGGYAALNNMAPPLSQNIATNINSIKLMGIKWIISADEMIKSNDLEFAGRCLTNDPKIPGLTDLPSPDWTEAGYLAVYKLKNPSRVVFATHDYLVMPHADIIKNIFVKRATPWLRDTVLIEVPPENASRSSQENFIEQAPIIVSETFNSAQIDLAANMRQFVIWSNLYRPFWHAHIDGHPTTVLRAYGGFMAVQVPPGKHIILFKYVPYDIYVGILLTIMAFIFALLVPSQSERRSGYDGVLP